MKPGHLEVFDGLRITTEHMEHLQEALHSAVQDLREILGLGKVYTGFDVTAPDAQTIIVMPGLAFDLKKNRIVCDEPKTESVSFGEGVEQLYVCVRHERVEDGLVENRPTLIWDSCRVVLHPALPEVADNMVPIARLDRTEDGTTFTVVRLPEPEADSTASSDAEDEIQEGETSPDGEASTLEPEEAGDEEEAPAENLIEEEQPEEDEGAVGERDPEARIPLPPLPALWLVRQGVAHLGTPPNAPENLSTLLAEPLRARLNRGDTETALRLTLAEHHVSLDFAPRDLRCLTLLSGVLSLTEPTNTDENGEAIRPTAQARAEGEATFANDQTVQHGLSTLSGDSTPQRFALTEAGLAHLPLAALGSPSPNGSALAGVLPQLSLLVQAAPASETGFTLTAQLAWQGALTENHLEALESQPIRFSWQAQVAWKSIGDPDSTH